MWQYINNTKVRVTALFAALLVLAGAVLPLVNAADTSAYTTLNSFSGFPAANLTVSGGNYAANEPIAVEATQNNARVATASTNTNANAEYSVGLTLPAKLDQGPVLITAKGQNSGLSSNNTYYVTPFSPSLTTNKSDSSPFGTLTVSGKGYAPNESVNINFAGATKAVSADATGSFMGATIVTPNVPAGSYQLIAVGAASEAKAVSYQYINGFFPSVYPSTYYLLPLNNLSFGGSGFAPDETVTVTNGVTGAALSSFTAGDDGSFKDAGSFKVASNYAGQPLQAVLTGSLSKATTSVTVQIGQYYPSVSPTKYYVLPTETVAFNGSGFASGETVTVTNNRQTVATATADEYGNLTAAAEVTVPASAAGTVRNYILRGEVSGGTGSVSVQVGNYNTQVSPSTYYVLPGGNISFTGSGFASGELVAIFSGLNNLGQIQAGADGSFMNAGNVQVGYNQANSSVSYNFVGQVSNATNNVTISVGNLQVMVSPSSYYVLPYEKFSVTATGLAPGESATLSNGNEVLATKTTDEDGEVTFENVSLMPNALGSATLTVKGATSNGSLSTTVGIGNYYPSIVLDNYYAKPGTKITANGSGFIPGETVTLAAGSATATATADDDGEVSASVNLPFGNAKNTLDFTFTGSLSKAVATTTATLAPFTPQVSPSTYYDRPGTPINFTGNEFVVGETVDISLNGTTIGTVVADDKGSFKTTNYALPYGKEANYSLKGRTSLAEASFSIGLAQFYAGLQLDNYYGNGGSTVTASGSGFAANEDVTIKVGSTSVVVKANAEGAISKAITIPYAAPGEVAVTATGAQSGAVAKTGFTVAQVYNSVQLASYAVKAGQAVTFVGSGFLPNDTIQVTTDRAGSYSFTAGTDGSFNNSGFVLPADLSEGPLTLTIRGVNSYTTAEITMYVRAANAE